MNYYLDTEFYERGPNYPIQLISIGIVAQNGCEYYAELEGINPAKLSPWLQENVVPHLSGGGLVKNRNQVASDILTLLASDVKPRFWAYFAPYDWVCFAQIFGTMVEMPFPLPNFCMDLKQEMVRLDIRTPMLPHTGALHNALADARWNRDLHAYIQQQEAKRSRGT